MSVQCDVILQPRATPEQLTALGTALWRWCIRATGDTGIYRLVNNQALADLMTGKLPASSHGDGDFHFRMRDEVSHGRQATIESLRREMPAKGVEDILVNGNSWNIVASKGEMTKLLRRD
jgi:hypothetical protein